MVAMSVADVCDLGAEMVALDAKLYSIRRKRAHFASSLEKLTEEEEALRDKLLACRAHLTCLQKAAKEAAAKAKKESKSAAAAVAAAAAAVARKVPRVTGVLVSLEQFQPMLEQLPTEPCARPMVDTLSSVHTIQGPSFTEDITKVDGFAAGRTITTYPLVADRTHHVCVQASFLFFLLFFSVITIIIALVMPTNNNSKGTPSAIVIAWR